ncbi:MAG: hypothetical protein RLZZ546_2818 [Bacteroidota bacterium]|jgi:rhodanese-related sulfurtransferase
MYLFGQSSKEFSIMVNNHLELTVPVIHVTDLYKIQNKVILLDARELKEYKISHINGAKHIGYNQPNFDILKGINKSEKIVIYCSIGYRSEKIGEQLMKMGYKNIFNLYGSIFEWVNSGFNIVDENNQSTNKIHVFNKDWSKWLTNKKYTKIID